MNQRNILHLQYKQIATMDSTANSNNSPIATIDSTVNSKIQSYLDIHTKQKIQEDTHSITEWLKALWDHYNMVPLIGKQSDTVIYVPKENNRSPEI